MDETNALVAQVFEFQGHELQVIIHNGRPAFFVNELCDALGYKNPRRALSKLPEHQRGVTIRDTLGGPQETNIVYEGGVYRLIFGSRLPNAEAFTDLVTDIILPAIRKTGSYTTQSPTLQLPEKATSKQVVTVLQHLETMVKEGQFYEEIPAYKYGNLEYALKKTRGYFEGFTMKSYSVDDTDADGNMYPHEYPPEREK